MTNLVTITNEELLTKLEESYLEEDHKNRLADTIGYMNEEQKNELWDLIEQSHIVKTQVAEADTRYAEDLAALNTEFDEKISNLEKELTNYTLGEYRKLEKSESEDALGDIESEIENL